MYRQQTILATEVNLETEPCEPDLDPDQHAWPEGGKTGRGQGAGQGAYEADRVAQ